MLFRWGLVVTIFLQFLAHLLTLSPGVTASDGPEIAAAAVTLGVIHPTGYPLFTLIAHAFTYLPLPLEAVIKIEIMNACFAAGASVFVAMTVRSLAVQLQGDGPSIEPSARRLWPRLDSRGAAMATTPKPDIRHGATAQADLAGILAGLLIGTSPLLWEQLRVPEVYTMHVFLVSWALFYWTRFELSRRHTYILLAAIPMGLGLAHHVTMVYMLPPAALYLVLRRPHVLVSWFLFPLVWIARRLGAKRLLASTDWKNWWVVWAGCVIGALPLGFYGYFLWADATTTGISWGAVNNWDALYNHMTGRQYQGYMKGLDHAELPNRLKGLPTYFERQFLLPMALPAVFGWLVLFRRMWPYGLTLGGYAALNLYHGLQYSVGDFRTYYLPAVVVFAIVSALGVWWLARHLCYRPQGRSLVAWGLLSALFFGLVAGSLYYYGHYANPRPNELPTSADAFMTYPAVGLVFLALVLAVYGWRRHGIRKPTPVYGGLSLCLLGAVLSIYATVGIARAVSFAGKKAGGAEYAASVAHTVSPGGVYLTLGDGKSFPMFYSQHVLNEGREFAVIDTRMIHRAWYREGYLAARHPVACDPLSSPYVDDIDGFFEACGDYQQRLDAYAREGKSWLKFDFGSSRSGRKNLRPYALDLPIKHGGDKRCQEPAFRRESGRKCDCWEFNTHEREWDFACAYSSEEQAVVRFNDREIDAHRIIEDHIDERPVFERNVFTRWIRRAKNGRGWAGPSNRRISGAYQLINRGPINQVLYWDDLALFDACGSDTYSPLPQPLREAPAEHSVRSTDRRPYEVNERPQLLDYSVLTAIDSDDSTDERFEFPLGHDISLSMHWFERYYYSPKARAKRGKPIRHGVRVCFFGADGTKIYTDSLRTTGARGRVKLPAEFVQEPGTYTVRACSVGEIGVVTKGQASVDRGRVPDEMSCAFPILEYQFEVVDSDGK